MDLIALPDAAAMLTVLALAAVMSFTGGIGGLGGAVLLVPVLVLLGWSATEAAPIGMAMVSASSLSAAGPQLANDVANHRLGVTMEIAASIGVAGGAALSVVVAPRALMYVLGISAIVAALVGGTRTGQRNVPIDDVRLDEMCDLPGRLGSAYRDEHGRVVPYQVRRLPAGLALMAGAGVVAGMTGSSGGYIKTPVMNEVMRIPVKVAGATTMFMVGITAAVALAVYASQGRISAAVAPAVLGGLLGGRLGARVQQRLPAPSVRRLLSAVLIVIGILVVVQA